MPKEKITISDPEKSTEFHMKELFDELGLEVEKINPNISRKLLLLNERTETFKDEERSIHVARALFKYYESQVSDYEFTDEEKRTVLIGTLFTDIGKTGPRDATPEQEELILSIYGVESRKHGREDVLSLKDYVESHFPAEHEEKVSKLRTMGLDTSMTMRQFWNMHSQWTLEIIKGDGVPPEAVAAAATHHMLEGVNPEEIVGDDGRFTKYFGQNASFDRAEKLIIILDKYDAFRRRGKKEHKEAIELLRNKVHSNPNFAEDEEFEELLRNLDAMITRDENTYG